ncbi:MAG TPA: STAS domain-containing protein [Acidimicrobiia bacterium]
MVEFVLTVSESEQGTVIAVAGDVDIATAPELRGALMSVPGDVTVDLADVSFMDSSGLNALIAGRKHATAIGHRFVVRDEPELVERAMRVTGVYEFLHSNGAAPEVS